MTIALDLPLPVQKLRQRRYGGLESPVLEQGDCWATAVANYANLDDGNRNELHRRISISRKSGSTGSKWWDITNRFLLDKGFLELTAVDEPISDRIYIATGLSPRGDFLHTVLAWGNGDMWWDSHPAELGIPEIIEWVCWWSPDGVG